MPGHGLAMVLLALACSRAKAADEGCTINSTLRAKAADEGCTITAKECQNFPEFRRTQFRDLLGEEHLEAASNEAACLKRAEEFHHWCGNSADEGVQVAATYNPKKWSQLYNPGACDKGWSQWDAFCYKFHLEMKTWFEAEQICRDQSSHLASVHSRAENRFVNNLAHGLKVWIGYTDVDQDTHYQWSDNTQDDFTNFAKNCSGREHEPDCKREEVQQQWYKGKGTDASPFVCKKNALLPLALLRNTSAAQLTETAWLELSAAAGAVGQAADTAKVGLKLEEIVAGAASEASSEHKKAQTPGPRFAVPQSFTSF
eukprot:gb/GFBE01067975.1/.p1 GENE.gb/GFBE01067975.1/~~gb/GFBE01067975.1/.p1  ORF type:complete len:314 (+),score=83.32 gb/GFBE01067975.1/:1-942(+)